MQQWEYLMLDTPTFDQLQEVGGDGWELVSVAPYTAATGVATGQYDRAQWHLLAYFKRPKNA